MENATSDGFVCVNVLQYAVSKASSNFSREIYRQRSRLKRRGLTPLYGGFLVLSASLSSCLHLVLAPMTFTVVAP